MSSYAIEDIEYIRARSGISYEEAVSLLDYHNGDVVQALVDLERKGKVGNGSAEKQNRSTGTAKTGSTEKKESFGAKAMNVIHWLYRTRLKVRKGDTVIANLSVLFALLAVLLFSPHLAVLSAILCLLLGYHISIDTKDSAFVREDLGRMVRNAAGNVRESVGSIARDINQAISRENGKPEAEPAKKVGTDDAEPRKAESATAAEQVSRSFGKGAATFVRDPGHTGADVPVMQIPVKVDSADGSVTYHEDDNGFSQVTVE